MQLLPVPIIGIIYNYCTINDSLSLAQCCKRNNRIFRINLKNILYNNHYLNITNLFKYTDAEFIIKMSELPSFNHRNAMLLAARAKYFTKQSNMIIVKKIYNPNKHWSLYLRKADPDILLAIGQIKEIIHIKYQRIFEMARKGHNLIDDTCNEDVINIVMCLLGTAVIEQLNDLKYYYGFVTSLPLLQEMIKINRPTTVCIMHNNREAYNYLISQNIKCTGPMRLFNDVKYIEQDLEEFTEDDIDALSRLFEFDIEWQKYIKFNEKVIIGNVSVEFCEITILVHKSKNKSLIIEFAKKYGFYYYAKPSVAKMLYKHNVINIDLFLACCLSNNCSKYIYYCFSRMTKEKILETASKYIELFDCNEFLIKYFEKN